MRELADGLGRRGHRSRVLTQEDVGGRTYLGFAVRLAARVVVAGRSRPAVIVARSTDGAVCALADRLLGLGTAVVLHNHGWEELAYRMEQRLPRSVTTSPTTWKAKLVRFVLLRLTLRLCRLCLSGTVHETRRLRRTYPHAAHKMVYVGNGVAPRPSPYWLEQSVIPPRFCAVGGPTWKKNLDHTLGLFAEIERRVPEARLHLVGTGVEEEELTRRVGTLHGAHTTRCEPYETMERWYRRCPYLLISSRYEGGHPLAALEAMSFGGIVIAARIPAVEEIVYDGRNGLLIGGCDPADDARRVLELLGDRQRAARLRRGAFGTAVRNRWQRQVARLERIVWTIDTW
jgi:glycosyltransferase involved in cell wall biosynthesis